MKVNNAFENVNLSSSVVLHLINMGWFVLFWCNSSCKLLWLNFDPWICFNDYVSLFPRTNCTPNHLHSPFLLSFPSVWTFLKLLFVSLTLSLSCPMTRSSLLFFHPFSSFSVCVCLVWECLCLMHPTLTCVRLLVKPRQPCSTGRCLRTCAAPRRTAQTTLRLLQSALLRHPLRA